MPGLDPDTIRHALTTARRNGFRQVRIKSEGEQFRAVLDEVEVAEESHGLAVADLINSEPKELVADIKAPCVGYFQEAPELQVGQSLEAGAAVGTITALGLRNEVTCKKGGKITEVLVSNNQPVEFGQVIAKVKLS